MRLLKVFFAVSVLFIARPAIAASAPCGATIVSTSITVQGNLTDIFVDDQCRFVYATNIDRNQVEVYSLVSGKLLSPIAVGSKPRALDASPDGNTLYVANSGGANISVVNASTLTETRKVTMPPAFENGFPTMLAAAANGLVFIATDNGSSSGKVFQYNPTTNAVTSRDDLDAFRPSNLTNIQASPDRSVIGLMPSGDSSASSVYRYESQTNRFTVAATVFNSIRAIGFDRTGAKAYLSAGGYVLDAQFNVLGTTGGANQGVAVDPEGAIGYAVDNSVVRTADLQSFQFTGQIPLVDPATVSPSKGQVSLSRDGVILAVTTGKGFEIVRVKGPLIRPTLRFVGFSPSLANESILRFYNFATPDGTAKVTLFDIATNDKLAEWTSPAILPGTAPQFSMGPIEALIPASARRSNYLVEVGSSFKGSFAHIIWQKSTGMLTNASTCESETPLSTVIINVHSSLLDASSSSYISIVNTGQVAAPVTLGIYNALGLGQVLGSYTATVPAKGAKLISMADVESAARINPSDTSRGPYYHYIVKIEGTSYSGYLQHLMGNRITGVVSDLTKVCALP